MNAAGALGGWARVTLHGASAPIQAEGAPHPVGRRAACNAVFTISVATAFLR